MRITILFLMFIYLFPSFVFALKTDNKPKITGYYKNLFITSKITSTKEDFFADTQRLRLQLDENFTDSFSLNITYDNDGILNDFSKTSDFDIIRHKNQKELAVWDADKTISDRKHSYWTHSLYRAYLKYFSHTFQAVLGKQAIDWSRMRFYHPMDLFNPISPLDIEKDEKTGVDAVNFEFYPETITSINYIYAPHETLDRSSSGLRLVRKIQDYDVSLILAKIKKDGVLGVGFDGNLYKAGFRGELTYTKKDNKREFTRMALGLDYNITPKFYALTEYFYNGGADQNTAQFLSSYESSRQSMSIRKHLLGTGLEYELSGVTKLAGYIFYDVKGKSVFFNPELRYNIKTNLDSTLGVQSFWGNESSEFGNYEHIYYLQIKYYF